MLIKDVVHQLLNIIQEVSEKTEGALRDKDHLIYFESQLAKAQLAQLLIKYNDSEQTADYETLSPFCEFLSDRWQVIQNTDANYSHRYYSHINQICIKMADIMSAPLKIPANKLLIPTLAMTKGYDIPLNKAILSDDNSRLIDVAKCLETAHQQSDAKLKHTYSSDGTITPLSEKERIRVIKHSPHSQRYYKDILESRIAYLEQNKKLFKKSLGENPQSTYADQGWITLEKNIFGQIYGREQLISILLKLKRTDWERFLDHIPFEKLSKIVLDGKTLISAAQNTHSYHGNEAHDRVMSFLLIDHYRKALNARIEKYTGLFGSWTGYSKEQKLDASLILYNYLRGDAEDVKLENLSKHLKKDDFKTHLGAMSWDTLGKLTNQILLLGTPEYRKKLETQYQQEYLKQPTTEEKLSPRYQHT